MERALPDIYILKADYEKLSNLAANSESRTSELLEAELDRAKILSDDEFSESIVKMGSLVKYKDMESEKVLEITLVYPEEANLEAGRVSILAPIGIALLGLKVGSVIRWPMPSGHEKELKVVEIL
ncbi:MAG: nucleoside diphosphate kinase regulator [Bdellovibrionales bacterium]|nr:nucleoside diphosphate kinase regulator [Bdellovibrionales bacterium]